jgi:hypothetical protein
MFSLVLLKEKDMDNTKETGPVGMPPTGEGPKDLSEEIMNLLYQRTPNPSEAFVMLQQMSVLLWEQYQIDWQDQPDCKVSQSRKQRYLDFVSGLVDSLLASKNSG